MVEELKLDLEIENNQTFQNLFNKLTDFALKHLVNFGLEIHKPVKTSQEAADIRGATLSSGAKAILIKEKTKTPKYFLIIFAADKKLSWKKTKDFLKIKRLEMANEEEAYQVTGCKSGGIPPFGSLFGIQSYMDNSIQQQGDQINFNAGLRTHSIVLLVKDYLLFENPIIGDFIE